MAATILICEDKEALRSLIHEALRGIGLRIAEATTGPESIEAARRLRPDVVLLDMVMPGCSGLDVLGELRADPSLANSAIVLMSGAAALRTADEVGADRFLLKPFGVAELRTTVEDLLGERRI